MMSKWYELKGKAVSLRRKGLSIRNIEQRLQIPRSTLSGWFKDIELTRGQKQKLLADWKNGLVVAQKKGGRWHFEQGQKRREEIRQEIEKSIAHIQFDKTLGEVTLAALYLAEGSKKENSFAFANSNPQILKGCINLLRSFYKIDEEKFRCCLHLRKDQNEKVLKNFWSKTLQIPKSKFQKTQFDKRTKKETYDHYKGVCVLYYHDLALQRRILYFGQKILDITNNLGG